MVGCILFVWRKQAQNKNKSGEGRKEWSIMDVIGTASTLLHMHTRTCMCGALC